MDTVPVKKAVNRVKASLDKRRGPAGKDQAAAPIADAIRDYWQRGMLTFGIPAHNGGRGPAPEIASLIGLQAVRCDLPMRHGVDTRDRAWQVQTTAQELFAEAVGAQQVLFSTNGSSLSVHVAIMASRDPATRWSWRATGTSRPSPGSCCRARAPSTSIPTTTRSSKSPSRRCRPIWRPRWRPIPRLAPR